MTVDTIIFYNNCRDYIVACVDDDDDDDDVATGGAFRAATSKYHGQHIEEFDRQSFELLFFKKGQAII